MITMRRGVGNRGGGTLGGNYWREKRRKGAVRVRKLMEKVKYFETRAIRGGTDFAIVVDILVRGKKYGMYEDDLVIMNLHPPGAEKKKKKKKKTDPKHGRK